MPEFADIIAANVRAERGRRKWLQKDLGTRLGWSGATISDLEVGRRTILASDLPKLCRAFNIPLTKLLDGANPEDLEALRL